LVTVEAELALLTGAVSQLGTRRQSLLLFVSRLRLGTRTRRQSLLLFVPRLRLGTRIV
jgi:hypothetical protein